ncbi:MAG: lipoyl protein ligase domain-containing protein [Opitutales bacterium]
MADDILLQKFSGDEDRAIVRSYGWSQEMAKTYGRYQPFREIEEQLETDTFTRRPTGGGLVSHKDDTLTWSLCVPRARLEVDRVPVLFQKCQSSIGESLRRLCGLDLDSARTDESRPGSCFLQPVNYDLMSAQGRKVSGVAMHRSKRAILFQGSLQLSGIELSNQQSSELMGQLLLDIVGIAIEKSVPLTTLIDAEIREAEFQRLNSRAWLEARP